MSPFWIWFMVIVGGTAGILAVFQILDILTIAKYNRQRYEEDKLDFQRSMTAAEERRRRQEEEERNEMREAAQRVLVQEYEEIISAQEVYKKLTKEASK